MVMFQDALYLLDYIGFTDVFLPFVLIFTIVFAVLQKIHLFSKEAEGSRKFNAIIALALAIGVIIPHSLGKYPYGTDVVEIINNALPGISLLIVAAVFLLILIGLFGGQTKWGENWAGGVVTFVAVALIVVIFGEAADWWEMSGIWYFLSDPTVQVTILVLLVFWMILSVITKEEGKPGAAEKFGQFFGGLAEAATKAEEKGKGGGG